ncbi:CPBP family intramembrane glutamic endopeptidase [Paenibacillus sedimenti]|uniref:CPBP family intramembrane metalloprotease n=1 Tax=Paenibacillus sedimenti TaxID=2770274 RepID=A0A926KP43_9BACL|nr:CPBP family intramembrane glutamic endopeptidase [Paenibacillus sedimenti]MBD0379679.1 CPBP family intramembrane metalloprotease [Paenibacillus sedimenti]
MNVVSVILIVMFPLLGYFYYKNLSKLGKIKFYYHLIGWYWALTAILYALNKDSNILTIEKMHAPFVVEICMWTGIIVWLISESLPVVLALTSAQYRAMVKREVILNDSMPLTLSERRVFTFVALTIGICEEVMWRGWLPSLLQDFSLPLWLSFVIAGIAFGLGHFLQGLKGIMNSLIFSVVATFVFLLSGSLLIPIILHILYDYRLVLTGVIISGKNDPQVEAVHHKE